MDKVVDQHFARRVCFQLPTSMCASNRVLVATTRTHGRGFATAAVAPGGTASPGAEGLWRKGEGQEPKAAVSTHAIVQRPMPKRR